MTEPDLLFAGGPALLRGGQRTDAVAVHNGQIVALGADARSLGGRHTIDLRGRLLIPGFQDAHCHPIWAGLEAAACECYRTILDTTNRLLGPDRRSRR